MSFEETFITSAAVQEIINKARISTGVHIYMDVPVTTQGLKLGTTLRDTQKGKVRHIKYTALLRATGPNAKFAVTIVDHANYYGMEVGLHSVTFQPYFDIMDKRKWLPKRLEMTNPFRLKPGEFVCVQMTTTNRTRFFEASLNGTKFSRPLDFQGWDLNHLWRYTEMHKRLWYNMEVLEHHFAYTNISEALEPNPNYQEISLKEATLTHFGIGGRAVIAGSYVKNNTRKNGVSIAVNLKGGGKIETTCSEKTNKICISLVVYGALVTTETEKHLLKVSIPLDSLVYLTITNFNITTIDINTGLEAVG